MADKYWVDLAEEEQVSPRDAMVGFTPPCRAGLPSPVIEISLTCELFAKLRQIRTLTWLSLIFSSL
jgi:hypothetical protein